MASHIIGIAGLVVGLVVGVALAGFTILFCCLWCNTRKELKILSKFDGTNLFAFRVLHSR